MRATLLLVSHQAAPSRRLHGRREAMDPERRSAKPADLDTEGIVGYRANHNLHVHLSALGIHKS